MHLINGTSNYYLFRGGSRIFDLGGPSHQFKNEKEKLEEERLTRNNKVMSILRKQKARRKIRTQVLYTKAI